MNDPWADPDFVRDEAEVAEPMPKIPYADTWPGDTPEMTAAGLRYHVVPDHDADATVESEWRR